MSKAIEIARKWVLEIVLLGLCVYLAQRSPWFLTAGNLLGVLRDVSMEGIIAFGMTAVIIAGEIDLSVGSMVGFAGCLAAWMVEKLTGARMGPVAAVFIAAGGTLCAGYAVGWISGFLRVRFLVPTFISTLAWMTVLRGAAGLITNGFPIASFPDWYLFLGGGYVWGVPFPAIVFLAVFLVVQFVMSFTTFGRAVYAVGGNAEAARLSGIRVGRVQRQVMAMVAVLAVLAGLMQASQITMGSPGSGKEWELDVISAVIIGGTNLLGGAGTVWGTLIGVLFLGVLDNGMTLLNVSPYWQNVVKGGLILVAVMLNMAPTRKRAS